MSSEILSSWNKGLIVMSNGHVNVYYYEAWRGVVSPVYNNHVLASRVQNNIILYHVIRLH